MFQFSPLLSTTETGGVGSLKEQVEGTVRNRPKQVKMNYQTKSVQVPQRIVVFLPLTDADAMHSCSHLR